MLIRRRHLTNTIFCVFPKSVILKRENIITLLKGTGRSLHCQVINHVRTKFATPILYAINNFKIYDFSIYTYPLITSFLYIFWNFLSSPFFLVIFLVQFYIILVRNGMFSRKNKLSNLVINLYYVINTMYMYSWFVFDKSLTHFVDAT